MTIVAAAMRSLCTGLLLGCFVDLLALVYTTSQLIPAFNSASSILGQQGGRSQSFAESTYSKTHTIQRRSVRKSATVGSSAVLECDINYPGGQNAERMIKWHKQGIEVPIYIQLNRLPPHIDSNYQGRIRLLDHASIEINNLRTKDEGWYECSIVFIQKPDDINPNGTWVYLSVTSPPVLGAVSPGFLIFREGSNAELFCEAAGTPWPTVTWLKDGQELMSSSHMSVNENKVIIKHLMQSDGGVYICLFKNTVAQVSHTIRVVVKDKDWVMSKNAYIMVPPKNTTSQESTRVKLSCQAEAFPNNITYTWFRNGVDVTLLTELMNRAGIYADGSFIISSVIREDTGWYKCQPSNGLGPPPEAEAFLNVTYLPRVLSMPSHIYLPLGMTGRIDCPVEANPPVTIIQWSKDEHLLNHSHMKVDKEGTLVISPVQLTDHGQYSCRPYSPLGDGPNSMPIQIIVKNPPYFTTRPRPIYQRNQSRSVTMPCVAEGDPTPTIQWRKVESTFPDKAKTMFIGGNLTIVQLTKEDQGTYECIATNLVTSVIATTLLIIELHDLHAPYNVTVRTTDRSAKVSWLPAYDGGHHLHYVLWYKKTDNNRDDWITLRVIPDDAISLTVYNLMPSTSYQFMVLSRNRLGEGLFSQPVSLTTKDDPEDPTEGPDDPDDYSGSGAEDAGSTSYPELRPSPPLSITVRPQKDGLHIAWVPPENSPVPVQYYVIEYRTVGQWVPLFGKHTKPWFTWPTPSFGAAYQFRVISYSQSSKSESSPVVTIHTGDPSPHGGGQVSSGVVGGIVGGLLLAFIAALLIALIVRLYKRKKQRSIRYGNVKYFGPNQVESSQNSNRMSEVGPICAITDMEPIPMLDNHITTLPHTNHDKKIVQETPI